jgi:hypothetical protein
MTGVEPKPLLRSGKLTHFGVHGINPFELQH